VTAAKICGLSTPETVSAAVDAGARFVGFVFYPPSPRNVSAAKTKKLATGVPPGVGKVGLFVDPEDDDLDAVLSDVPLDFIQVHGVTAPDRLRAIRQRTGLPLIVAQAVSSAEDVDAGLALAGIADMLLFDAKPATGGGLPGGNGVAFDWRLLSTRRISIPWMLAGGLTPHNVSQAIMLTGAKMVDVSSGVESAPGVKDGDLIRAFVAAAG
jgi:phosphoribosylanthranilate isomerase